MTQYDPNHDPNQPGFGQGNDHNNSSSASSAPGGPSQGGGYDPNQSYSDPYGNPTSYGDQSQQYPQEPTPYPAGGAYGPGMSPYGAGTEKNALGGWALGLGIASVCCSWFTGIPAIICGAMGISAANRGQASNKTRDSVGLSLGIAFSILNTIGVIVNYSNGLYQFSH